MESKIVFLLDTLHIEERSDGQIYQGLHLDRYSLDYKRPVVPPLAPADAEWAQQVLNPSRIAQAAEADTTQ